MRSITDIVKQFKQNWTEELNPINIERACRDCGMTWIESMLNPVVTIQLFLLQILHGNTACTHVPRLARMAFTAAGYCKARMRVKLEVLELLLQRCAESVQGETLDAGVGLGIVCSWSMVQASRCPTRLCCKPSLDNPAVRNRAVGFPSRIG